MPIFKKTRQVFDEHEIILGCNCSEIDHQIKVCYYDDEKDFISFCVTLVSRKGFFRRLWDGIKYAFGYKSRCGNFDEVLLYRDDVTELIEYLKGFVECQ